MGELFIYIFSVIYLVGFGFYYFYIVFFCEESFWKVFIWPLLLVDELLAMRRDK